jgi:hypothetical protein
MWIARSIDEEIMRVRPATYQVVLGAVQSITTCASPWVQPPLRHRRATPPRMGDVYGAPEAATMIMRASARYADALFSLAALLRA